MEAYFIDGHHPEPITTETPLDHLMALEEADMEDDAMDTDASSLAGIPLNALGVILRYLVPPAGTSARWRTATKRLICLSHAAGLDGIADRSLASIAKELGCTRAALSHHAIRIADELRQEQVRGGKKRSSRETYRKAALKTHRLKGHTMRSDSTSNA
tara:strand:- start:767 stop:1240 length:474 start_codon:yes stop_codon:yes gene_type:complete